MKKVILLFMLLALGVYLGLLIQSDSGYVLIAYGHWTLETSVWFVLIALLCVWAIGLLGKSIVHGMQAVWRLPVRCYRAVYSARRGRDESDQKHKTQ
jgi:HemY protein